ncbi:MAG: MFS transporter [Thermoplasmata archaeon]|nr:MFS transporter [Thermoplasmata archaeon]
MKFTWYGRMLFALYTSTFIIRLCFGIILIVLPYYLRHTVSDFMFGLIWGASPFAEMISVMFIGLAVDRFGRKRVLLVGLLTGALSLVLYGVTQNPYLLMAINAFHGVAAAAILVSSLALVADYAAKHTRGREMGAFDFANLFGWFSGFLVGGVLVDLFSTSLAIPFVLGGVLALLGFAFAYIAIVEPEVHKFTAKDITPKHVINVLTSREILLLVLPWLMLYIMIGVILSFFSLESAQISMPGTSLALVLGGGGTIFLATQIFYGKMADKYGRTPVLFIGTVGVIGVVSTVAYSVYLSSTKDVEGLIGVLMGSKPLLGLLGISAFLAGAFGPSALASLADECPQRAKGVTMALYSIVISAGMSIGPPAAGFLSDHSGTLAVFLFLVACAGLMLLFVVIRYMDLKKREAVEGGHS